MTRSARDPISTLLVLDDDSDVRKLLAAALGAAGYEVLTASTVQEAMQAIGRSGLPALAIVDLKLEAESGLDFCRQVHEFSDLPIVVLTSVTAAQQATVAIERYAEDYVRKPFDAGELVARVQRILKRVGTVAAGAGGTLQLTPDVCVDLVNQRVWVHGVEATLTPTECRILHVLARNAGRTVETATLLRRLWPDQDVFEDTLRVHIHRLRRKLEPGRRRGDLLVTERGIGYRIERAS